MTPDQRRAIYEKARDNAVLRGIPMDNDPVFLEAIEDWIAGDIEMDGLKARYAQLLSERCRSSSVTGTRPA
jgi:hypothetical protein